ncbi:hypothetical protein AB0F91_24950 [Amycolatopsis sp. NPDC023774]|uniref:hypothetical protein n=1 Tax=Amycolatopsis sp. NPDC023774 TaxID=3155015 RepID=UPI0033E7F000
MRIVEHFMSRRTAKPCRTAHPDDSRNEPGRVVDERKYHAFQIPAAKPDEPVTRRVQAGLPTASPIVSRAATDGGFEHQRISREP